MKYLAIIAFLAIVLAVEAARKPPKPPKRRCDNDSDCNPDECCLARPFGLNMKGDCKKLTREGKRCDNSDDFGGKHLFGCPCAEGLTCKGKKKEIEGLGVLNYKFRCLGEGSTTPYDELTTDDSSSSSSSSEETTEAEEFV
ncbi:hypothetical protein X975_06619, partial [Stegodyphus mimosarum]